MRFCSLVAAILILATPASAAVLFTDSGVIGSTLEISLRPGYPLPPLPAGYLRDPLTDTNPIVVQAVQQVTVRLYTPTVTPLAVQFGTNQFYWDNFYQRLPDGTVLNMGGSDNAGLSAFPICCLPASIGPHLSQATFDAFNFYKYLYTPDMYPADGGAEEYLYYSYTSALGVDALFGPGAAGQRFYTEVIEGVPEPATWALFIVGFGFIGGALRRTRLKAA